MYAYCFVNNVVYSVIVYDVVPLFSIGFFMKENIQKFTPTKKYMKPILKYDILLNGLIIVYLSRKICNINHYFEGVKWSVEHELFFGVPHGSVQGLYTVCILNLCLTSFKDLVCCIIPMLITQLYNKIENNYYFSDEVSDIESCVLDEA